MSLQPPKITPGQPMSAEDKQKLADYNAEQTAQAQKMAADHRARDDRESPLVETLASSIRSKLNPEHLEPPK